MALILLTPIILFVAVAVHTLMVANKIWEATA